MLGREIRVDGFAACERRRDFTGDNVARFRGRRIRLGEDRGVISPKSTIQEVRHDEHEAHFPIAIRSNTASSISKQDTHYQRRI